MFQSTLGAHHARDYMSTWEGFLLSQRHTDTEVSFIQGSNLDSAVSSQGGGMAVPLLHDSNI